MKLKLNVQTEIKPKLNTHRKISPNKQVTIPELSKQNSKVHNEVKTFNDDTDFSFKDDDNR